MPFDQISRFTESGKTFFFNREKTRGGSEYLAINTMRGSPPAYEKLTLLPGQFLSFRKHLTEAVEALTDVKFTPDVPDVPTETPTPLLPHTCTNCAASWEKFDIAIFPTAGIWQVICTECNYVMLAGGSYVSREDV